jgi:hypothetical protein
MKKAITRRCNSARQRDPSPYPKGWNRKRAQNLIDYYENQSDEDAIAEAEAAYKKGGSAMIEIPVKLIPQVQKLLARRAG